MIPHLVDFGTWKRCYYARMRIALFSDTFHPQVNGVATSVATLADELVRRGHDVLIFAPRPPAHQRNADPPFGGDRLRIVFLRSVPIFFYPEFRFGLFFFFTALRRLRAFRPDVIHVQSPLSIGIAGAVIAKLTGVPLVGTQHVYLTSDNADFLKFLKVPNALKRFICRIVHAGSYAFFSRCDLLVTPSKELVEAIKRDGYRRRVEYLSNGLRLSDFRVLSPEERSALLLKYGLQPSVVLHVGRVSREKNIDALLRAFARLKALKSDVSLVVIGHGPAMQELKALAASLGITGSVSFLGVIAHDELLRSGILSLGTLFATASTMESQGMVVLEAMCTGLPITCVGEAGVTELIDGNGLLSSRGDTEGLAQNMLRILSDEALRREMSEKSRVLARRYSVDFMAERLLGFYAEILAQRRQKQK